MGPLPRLGDAMICRAIIALNPEMKIEETAYIYAKSRHSKIWPSETTPKRQSGATSGFRTISTAEKLASGTSAMLRYIGPSISPFEKGN